MAGPGRRTEQPPKRSIDIDTQGRIAVSDAARSALADRAGHFALLPSSHDLIVLARAGATGGPAVSPRCVLAGDLSVFPIADFLAFIHTTRASGMLTVVAGGVERAIAFQDGEVRAATSQAPAERVGEVALRMGYLKREQLDAVDARGMRFGDALVAAGLLAPEDLWKCFHEQVTTVFHAILLAQEGIFYLTDTPELDLGASLSIGTQSLLMDGIRRIDELSLFASKIPGAHAFVRRRDPRRAVRLEPLEEQLLELVDGRRRVFDIAHAARLSEFDAMKILYHLAEAGYVEAFAGPALGAPPPAVAALVELARAANGALRAIASAAAVHDALDGLRAATRAFLADPASRFEPLFRRVDLAEDGALDEPILLGNLSLLRDSALRKVEPTGDLSRYLRDALREAVFFQLFHLSERLPAEEDELLAADVRQRLEAAGGLG
jgi:hypothetical protein